MIVLSRGKILSTGLPLGVPLMGVPLPVGLPIKGLAILYSEPHLEWDSESRAPNRGLWQSSFGAPLGQRRPNWASLPKYHLLKDFFRGRRRFFIFFLLSFAEGQPHLFDPEYSGLANVFSCEEWAFFLIVQYYYLFINYSFITY